MNPAALVVSFPLECSPRAACFLLCSEARPAETSDWIGIIIRASAVGLDTTLHSAFALSFSRPEHSSPVKIDQPFQVT